MSTQYEVWKHNQLEPTDNLRGAGKAKPIENVITYMKEMQEMFPDFAQREIEFLESKKQNFEQE